MPSGANAEAGAGPEGEESDVEKLTMGTVRDQSIGWKILLADI
jgi:hypothetical protein